MAASIQPIRPANAPQSESIDRVLININAEVAACGISLKLHTDFELFRDVVARIPDRGEITSLFNPDMSDIGPDNGFWVEGTDAEGQVVHVQAFRMDDLKGTSLANHWRDNPEWFAPPGADVDLSKTNFNTASVSHEMSGTVCYHGDFWIHRKYRKFRLAGKLSTFAMLLAEAKFNPDYIYCFIVPKHVKQGLAAMYGYLHIHPYAPQWRFRGSNQTYDDYLVWISGAEIKELWMSGERDTEILGQVGKDGNGNSTASKSVANY